MGYEYVHATERFVEVRHATRKFREFRAAGERILATVHDHFVVVLSDGIASRTEVFVSDAAGEVTNWFPLMSAPSVAEATARLHFSTAEQWAALVATRPVSFKSPVPAVFSGTSEYRAGARPSPEFTAGAGLLRHALLVAGVPSGDRFHGSFPASALSAAIRTARSEKRTLPVPVKLWEELGWAESDVEHVFSRLDALAAAVVDAGFADVAWTAM